MGNAMPQGFSNVMGVIQRHLDSPMPHGFFNVKGNYPISRGLLSMAGAF